MGNTEIIVGKWIPKICSNTVMHICVRCSLGLTGMSFEENNTATCLINGNTVFKFVYCYPSCTHIYIMFVYIYIYIYLLCYIALHILY